MQEISPLYYYCTHKNGTVKRFYKYSCQQSNTALEYSSTPSTREEDDAGLVLASATYLSR